VRGCGSLARIIRHPLASLAAPGFCSSVRPVSCVRSFHCRNPSIALSTNGLASCHTHLTLVKNGAPCEAEGRVRFRKRRAECEVCATSSTTGRHQANPRGAADSLISPPPVPTPPYRLVSNRGSSAGFATASRSVRICRWTPFHNGCSL
jgi:hypothetical protein